MIIDADTICELCTHRAYYNRDVEITRVRRIGGYYPCAVLNECPIQNEVRLKFTDAVEEGWLG